MRCENFNRNVSILELGCGKRRRYSNSVGLDKCESSQPDVVHDLNIYPYPFQDNAFDLVVCEHVLEHLNDLVRTIEELHRILKPGGILRVEVPYFSSVFAYSDPTHRHFFTSRSFDYFLEGTAVSLFDYSRARFILRKRELLVGGKGPFQRLLHWFTNRYTDVYEKRLAFVLPRHTILFELEAVKAADDSQTGG